MVITAMATGECLHPADGAERDQEGGQRIKAGEEAENKSTLYLCGAFTCFVSLVPLSMQSQVGLSPKPIHDPLPQGQPLLLFPSASRKSTGTRPYIEYLLATTAGVGPSHN